MRKFSLLIYVFILLFIFLSLACITYSDHSNSVPIWKIGENDGDNNEFESPFNQHFYIKNMSDNEFQRDINDGARPDIYIHYNLTDNEAGQDLKLFLDTLHATHGTPYFNMRIKVKPSGGAWSEIGEYKFGSGDSNYPEERYISIWEEYVEPGENIILLENANPVWSDYWLEWDSLKLETVVVSDGPGIIRMFLEAIQEFLEAIREAFSKIILGVLGISFIFIGLMIILKGTETIIILPKDVRVGSGAIVFLTGVVLLLISIFLPLIKKIIDNY